MQPDCMSCTHNPFQAMDKLTAYYGDFMVVNTSQMLSRMSVVQGVNTPFPCITHPALN